jgi:fumarylacetoacetase
VFSHDGEAPRVGRPLGDDDHDRRPARGGRMPRRGHVFEAPTLNAFLAMGRPSWSAVRSWLVELVTHGGYRDLVESYLVPQAEVAMQLPFEVADYVDFYSPKHHAENVGASSGRTARRLTPLEAPAHRYHGRPGRGRCRRNRGRA